MAEQDGSTVLEKPVGVHGTLDAGWTVPGLFREAVRHYGPRPFLQAVGGAAQTYEETWESAAHLARCLSAQGVRAEQRVLVMLPNTQLAVHAWLAANLLNAVDVSINTGYKGQSFEHAANLSGAQLLVTTSDYLPVVLNSAERLTALRTVILMDDDPADVTPLAGHLQVKKYCDLEPATTDCVNAHIAMPWDIASVIYTSGTSGPAKGVMMPHGQVALLAKLSAAKTGLHGGDTFFSFYPMYHMAGKFMSVLATMSVGGRIVLDVGFAASDWLNRIREYGATVTAAHGPMLEMVFAQPPSPADKDHRLRLIRTAPFPKRIAAAFEERFGVKGMEVWGMTEVGVACWADATEPLKVGSCGRVDTDWYEFAVVDPVTDMPLPAGQVGEFVLRPKKPWTMMQGYQGMPERTLEAWRNLWFHTGDCGYVDADGYVYFVDRAKERIRRRAENISAGDIEAAALAYPGVAEAAAVGVSSGFEGDDDILLCLVMKPGQPFDPVQVLRFLLKELPHFMVPRYLREVTSLPRTPTGKLQRAMLKDATSAPDVWDRKTAGIALRDLAEAPATDDINRK